jgi:hypothetical protein
MCRSGWAGVDVALIRVKPVWDFIGASSWWGEGAHR